MALSNTLLRVVFVAFLVTILHIDTSFSQDQDLRLNGVNGWEFIGMAPPHLICLTHL